MPGNTKKHADEAKVENAQRAKNAAHFNIDAKTPCNELGSL
jgi:hypothetical protein